MIPTMKTVETHNIGNNDEKEGLLMRLLRAHVAALPNVSPKRQMLGGSIMIGSRNFCQ